jgi:serine/threonine protein phosphatase PrpC
MKIKILQPQAIHELGKRENQEDTIYPQLGSATISDRLFIVCDGMGGHEKGEVASQTVCSALTEYISNNCKADEPLSDYTFTAALEYAFSKLDEKDNNSIKKMGTTLTFLCLHRGGCIVAHIGDSRIYHIRPSESRLLYKSRDHSLVFDLYQAGEISYDEMKTSPQKNIITRAMQPGKDNRVKADIVHITNVRSGDYFYLCSDGMLEQMTDDELISILHGKMSDEAKRNQLITATADNSDNHSAYLIHIENVEKERGDETQPNDEATTRCNALNIHPKMIDAQNDVQVVSEPVPNKPVTTAKNHNLGQKNNKNLIMLIAVLLLAFSFLAYSIYKKIHKQKEKTEIENRNIPTPNKGRNTYRSPRVYNPRGLGNNNNQNHDVKNEQHPEKGDATKTKSPTNNREQPSLKKNNKDNTEKVIPSKTEELLKEAPKKQTKRDASPKDKDKEGKNNKRNNSTPSNSNTSYFEPI